MGHTILLRSPKREEKQEEEQVLENSLVPELTELDDDFTNKEVDVVDDFEGIFSIEDTDSFPMSKGFGEQLSWDFMDWEEFGFEEEEESDQKEAQMESISQESYCFGNVKRENCGFWDDYDQENKVSLNLSLNYQEVLEAWSNRGSHFADDYALQKANSGYTGEVPEMEEDRTRREASVMRYKEKRQNRLFSKKIRYQVRKLNADNRPRLKGRFVKRMP